MTVHVLYCTDTGSGSVSGVFSTAEKLAEYVANNSYSSFVITEHEVDALLSKKTISEMIEPLKA